MHFRFQVRGPFGTHNVIKASAPEVLNYLVFVIPETQSQIIWVFRVGNGLKTIGLSLIADVLSTDFFVIFDYFSVKGAETADLGKHSSIFDYVDFRIRLTQRGSD